MGQEALRDLWTQLPLGPLRKNASVMTMRRTIKVGSEQPFFFLQTDM